MDGGKTIGPLSLRERDRVRESEKLLSRARTLRKESSEAEQMLWKYLRSRRMKGFKFRRQVMIEPYIVDFACFEARLIIEADGGQHAEQVEYDALRTTRLESMGYRVMRFWNNQILSELPAVLDQIEEALFETPHPNPLPEGEGVMTE